MASHYVLGKKKNPEIVMISFGRIKVKLYLCKIKQYKYCFRRKYII